MGTLGFFRMPKLVLCSLLKNCGILTMRPLDKDQINRDKRDKLDEET